MTKAEVAAVEASLKKALEDTSDEAREGIESATAKLAQSSQKMGEAMYAAGAADAGAAGESAEESSDEDVVDAEIVDEGTG